MNTGYEHRVAVKRTFAIYKVPSRTEYATSQVTRSIFVAIRMLTGLVILPTASQPLDTGSGYWVLQ